MSVKHFRLVVVVEPTRACGDELPAHPFRVTKLVNLVPRKGRGTASVSIPAVGEEISLEHLTWLQRSSVVETEIVEPGTTRA